RADGARNVGRSLTSRLLMRPGPVIFLPTTSETVPVVSGFAGSSLPELRPRRHDPTTSAAPACHAKVGRPRRQVAAKGVGEIRAQIPFARGGTLANLLRLNPEPLQQLGQMPRGERPALEVGPRPLLEPDQVANDGGRGELVGGAGGEKV